MKRLIPAAILLGIIVTVCVISSVAISNTVEDTRARINKCETLYKAGQFDEAELCARNFEKKWSKIKKITSIYANHRPLDDISNLAAILPRAVSERNDFEFYSATARIKTLLDLVLEEQSFTLDSLY